MVYLYQVSKKRASQLSLGLAGCLWAQPQANAAPGLDPTKLFGLPVTNSMITSWVFSILIIVLVRALVKRPKLLPTTGQYLVETLVEGVRNIVKPIVGTRMLKPTFPLLVGLFTFILMHNWSGLFPGVGTIGYVDDQSQFNLSWKLGEWLKVGTLSDEHFKSFVRPATADLNMTLGLAVIHFAAWLYFVMRYAGPRVLIYDLFGNKADKREIPTAMFYFLSAIFLFVGVIEVISILFRNVSLPFRLFGNVFGGENLLHKMTSLVDWIVPVPFYFLELLIGFVQALVFVMLVSVYIGLICNHDSEEHAH